MHRLSRQQQLQPEQHGLLLMPPEGFHERCYSGAAQWLPDYLRELP